MAEILLVMSINPTPRKWDLEYICSIIGWKTADSKRLKLLFDKSMIVELQFPTT